MNKKVLIAMSGGVDSSVAAHLIKEQGYDCVGVTMKLFSKEGENVTISDDHSCCTTEDIEDARKVAEMLGMPFQVVNFADRFRQDVVEKFVDFYEHARTPNPCVDCNRYLKFTKLFQKARELGCDYVATGHYVQVEYNEESGRYLLKKAADPTKDQSYVLYSLTQEQLSHAVFPLGGMSKTEARDIAETNGFVNARKHDSQDICFIPDGKYAEFIERYTGKTYPAGSFTDGQGNILGEHKGIIRYTIGQRKGLGLSLKAPMYVTKLDIPNNRVILGSNEDLFTRSLDADHINLISVPKIEAPMRVKAKVRYRQAEQWAIVTQTGEDTLHIEFEEPQRAITSGQAVVLYDGDIVVGGGTIR